MRTLGILEEGGIVVSYIAHGVNEEEPYMKGFYNTLLKLFLKGVSIIKKQSQGRLEGRVRATIALNQTISSKEWGRDMYHELFFSTRYFSFFLDLQLKFFL